MNGVAKYRKRPVVIEAIQYTDTNRADVMAFCSAARAHPAYRDYPHSLLIGTLEGDHTCLIGDFVVKGVAGEFYPVKPHIFEATYTPE